MTHLKAWLETPLAAAIGWTLFHSLWEGALIAVLLAATLAFTRSTRGRYMAACLAMCAIVVCFAVTLLRLVPRHQTAPNFAWLTRLWIFGIGSPVGKRDAVAINYRARGFMRTDSSRGRGSFLLLCLQYQGGGQNSRSDDEPCNAFHNV